MKYLNSSNNNQCTPVHLFKPKWILLPKFSFLFVQIIFLNLILVSSFNSSSSPTSLDSFFFNFSSWPIVKSSPFKNRSKRQNNNLFLDSDQSMHYYPSQAYKKTEFGQSDYWSSIRRKWQQSELCPCQCIFDQFNRRVINCDEQFSNLTSIPTVLDPNAEVSSFKYYKFY